MKYARTYLATAAAAAVLATACREMRSDAAAPEENRSIVVCGERIPIGTRVVLWDEPPYYDAYKPHPAFADEGPEGPRFRPGRAVADAALQARVDERGFRPDELRDVVDQLVLHYDVCGVSRRCFRVLQDLRKLSVHFLLDIDGTIYQTLDLADQAWHATKANPRSVGVEIASIGAYPPEADDPLDAWYARDAAGLRIRIPAELGDGGVRTAGFVGRPARAEFVEGDLQGQYLRQADFTPEQYEALIQLTAGLCRAFPRLAPDAPRGAEGRVKDGVLTDAEFDAFGGVLGHYHVQENKVDPGPGFDWEPFLARVRAELERR
ncbi:MAG: peptidoglycan recognition family protein [Planctomycetota bacterium]